MKLTNTLGRDSNFELKQTMRDIRSPNAVELDRSRLQVALAQQANLSIEKLDLLQHARQRAQIWAAYAIHENFGTSMQVILDEPFG